MTGEAGIILPHASAPPAPPLVSGYVWYIDASNPSSYSGSGSTWLDLSGNSNTVSLVNSPTFDGSDGGGSIVFHSASNQNGTYVYSSSFNLNATDYELEAWVKFTSFSAPMIVVSKDQYGANFDWCIYIPDNTHIANYTAATGQNITIAVAAMSTGVWYHISLRQTGFTCTVFLNGVSQGGGTMFITNADVTAGTVACDGTGHNNAFLDGKLGLMILYKQTFADADVLNNFNAKKTQYGY